VSAWSIDTFFQSSTNVTTLAAWLNATAIPANSTVQLNCGTLDELLPGIADFYGADRPVNLHFKVMSFGNIGIYEDNQEMDGTLTIQTQYWVQLTNGTWVEAAQVTLANTKLGFTATVADMNVTLAIQQIKSTTVQVDYCAFGTISPITFKLKLNLIFTTFKVYINKLVADRDIVIPSNIAGLFILSDLYIEYYNDYIYAGATPTFLGTPAQATAMYYGMNPLI